MPQTNALRIDASTDLRIEASHDDLVKLKEALYKKVKDVDLQEDAQITPGVHGEPILIGLVVALGGATLTREVFLTIRHWMDERHKEKALDAIKLHIQTAKGKRDVTLEELMKSVAA